MLVENHPLTPSMRALKAGARTVFIKVWPVLKSLPQMGAAFFLDRQTSAGVSTSEIRCAIGEGHALAERGVGIDLRRSNAGIVGFESLLEVLDALVNCGGLQEDFGRAAPDHDHAIDGLAEGTNVFNHQVGELALGLALLDVGSVQALDVILIEDCRHGLDGFEIRLELRENFRLQHGGVSGRLVDVVFKNIPAGKDDIVPVRPAAQNP